MARGVKTGGRKKGVKNKATAAKARAIAASGVTPLDFMLGIMRAPQPTPEDGEEPAVFVARYVGWRDRALDAAKAAAPYVHPKLANIEHTGKDGGAIQSKVSVEFIGKAP